MNDPKRFSEANSLQLQYSQEHLKDVKDLFRWQENETILDVGSGDGKVTTAVLLPFIPKSVNQLVGLDVSKAMVDHARKHSYHPKISYVALDIAGPMPEKFKENFDHIFSFNCLMFVEDQRKAFENLFNMLKPGAQMMFSVVLKGSILAGILDISKNLKWTAYTEKIYDAMYPYQQLENPGKMLQNILISQGFNIQYFKVHTKSHRYLTPVFEKFALSVVPFINRIPEDKIKAFNSDFQDAVRKYTVEIIGDSAILQNLVATVLVSK